MTKTLLISLYVSFLFITFMLCFLINKKSKQQLHKIMTAIFGFLFIWFVGILSQFSLSDFLNISPIYFDYVIYIAACFIPVMALLLSLIFANTKIKLSSKWLLLFAIPTLSLIVLWTNDFHHLFYITYSTQFRETVFGPYFLFHSAYSYLCTFIAIIIFIYYSIKNAGFFSKQSILICLGTALSLIINILATFGIIDSNIYITPLSFAVALSFIALAIFKFNILNVAPIALQKIVDRMSDGYIVINEDNVITDFNKTFLDLFSLKAANVRNKNVVDLINEHPNLKVNLKDFKAAILKTKTDNATVTIKEHFESINKYFKVEINSITSKKSFLGTLILLKDVTQHNIDMQTIKANQDMLIEKERLATLGQMIGGIAHNLKTPIMSISGAAEGISDLVKEYDVSIEDPEVTHEDHHAIAHDMDEWIEKIRTHLAYMSDVITAVKGQAVTFSDNSFNGFTVDELIKHVDILMKHELKNALINLNTTLKVPGNTKIDGNINSLVQVINNIISNAIQAYNGRTNETIDFSIYSESKDILTIKIKDNAGGLPDKVQKKLFKEMITTKGKNGTGLGLFMSYSNIKAHFSGNMRFESKKNKGTSFFIEIPI